MDCPKCHAAMEPVAFKDITVERCTGCKGIWFDALQDEKLKGMKGSDVIDIGAASVGKKFNAIGNIDCPVCHTRMIRMVDVDQPHIWFESCKVCNGVFFDAGEFRDFHHHTFADFFRDLFAKERR